MRAGQTEKFLCDCCGKEFEITLEPHCPDAEEASPDVCPFCGSDVLQRAVMLPGKDE